MIAVPDRVGQAMLTQLERVNEKSITEQLEDALREIERLQRLLQMKDRRILGLTESREATLPSFPAAQPPASLRAVYSPAGHELIDPKEFADKHRVSIATVNRRLNRGDLAGVRPDGYHWMVYADQPFQKHSRSKKVRTS